MSVDSGKPYQANSIPGHDDPSSTSSASSSASSSRRSSLSAEPVSSSFDSLPTLRTKAALGDRKGPSPFIQAVNGVRLMRSRERERFASVFEREEKELREAGEDEEAKEGGKLHDLYAVQQQQISMLEQQLNEVNSNYDALRRVLDDLQRQRPRVDVDARLEQLELSVEKIKASQNRNFRLIYDRLNDTQPRAGNADSTWTADLLMTLLTWFLTGLAFVVQPISYAVSRRGALLSTFRVSGGKKQSAGKRAGGSVAPPVQAAAAALTALAASGENGGKGSQSPVREGRDGERDRERRTTTGGRRGGGPYGSGDFGAERGGERDKERERRNRSRDLLDVHSARREGRGSREYAS